MPKQSKMAPVKRGGPRETRAKPTLRRKAKGVVKAADRTHSHIKHSVLKRNTARGALTQGKSPKTLRRGGAEPQYTQEAAEKFVVDHCRFLMSNRL